jgi:formate dehydrogenase subunit gamma
VPASTSEAPAGAAAVTTTRTAAATATGGRVRRFDRVERAAHWLTALLVLTLVVTGVILYVPSFSVAVGRRLLIEDIHLYTGVAVFVPLVVAALGPWGRRLRADLASMNRLTRAELSWLRRLGRSGRESVGKFNPGQKLNTYGIGALLVVLFVTGLILRWGNFLAVGWRTGATFVHDWFALAAVVVIGGHILFAVTHPPALRSMVTGTVRRAWAAQHAPAWRPDIDPAADSSATGRAPAPATPPITLGDRPGGPESGEMAAPPSSAGAQAGR